MTGKQKILIAVSAIIVICSVGYFCAHFSDVTFRDAAMGNLFATIISVGLGVPTALWLAQEAEKREDQKEQEQIQTVLERVLVQVANAEQQIEFLSRILHDKKRLMYQRLSQVEVITSLHRVLTNLQADKEMLLALDIVIADLSALNDFFKVSHVFSQHEEEVMVFGIPSEEGRELRARIVYAREAIKDFRESVKEKYPEFWSALTNKHAEDE